MDIVISKMNPHDIAALDRCISTGGHMTEPDYFKTAWGEQESFKREVYVACAVTEPDKVVGYAHLNFYPLYQPFRRLSIPEIQDLFVHPSARQNGIGAALIQHCMARAKELGKAEIGIGVGVSHVFGPAQRLYTKLGFVPDGAGVVFDRQKVQSGDLRPIDDRLCLMMVSHLFN